ncbi:hypothetical protein LEP1GSC036_4180 [Leptospira weilii str. 2006001853]|uniref:Uncharacterized protein n=1 Tax=Leptospira weilii str. 2006001853 TaxID=1001589 RepID=A0A828YZH9_9LEPT|nr:hypothetical protein LEP1GSC036_4180 [Leptospira weilii str. 2006001853]
MTQSRFYWRPIIDFFGEGFILNLEYYEIFLEVPIRLV